MAYIGKQPVVGNFQVCDAISVVNGQAAYTMQVASTNVEPENANHMLVSLNGILQKPGSSFTISGATITFASNLVTNDVIDFIILLGDTLNVGTPSDDSVGAAQIKNDLISGTTALTSAPDDTDELLISDAGTLKRIDYSLIKSAPGLNLISTTTVSSGTANVDITSGIDSTYKSYQIQIIDLHPATDDQYVKMRFFNSSGIIDGSNYGTDPYNYSVVGYRETNTSITGYGQNSDAFLLTVQGVGNGNTESFSGIINLFNPSLATYHKLWQGNITQVNSAGAHVVSNVGGRFADPIVITGVRFFMGSGNIDSGTFKLYGIS